MRRAGDTFGQRALTDRASKPYQVLSKSTFARYRRAVRALVLACLSLTSINALAQADWTLRTPSVSPPARASAAMAQLGRDVVLFGGSSTASGVLGDTWIWDGTNWRQITSFGLFGTGPRPPARSNAVMAYDPASGTAVLFGGQDANGHLLSDTWVFAASTNSLLHRSFFEWVQQKTSLSPPAREDATMGYDAKSATIVLTGGFSFSAGSLQDSWAFDPGSSKVAPSWRAVTIGPEPARSTAAMAQCAIDSQHSPDRILLFGGFESASPFVLDDSWVYLTTTFFNTQFSFWGEVFPATQPAARFRHAMAFYPITNQVVLYGGGGSGVVFNDTWTAFCGKWTQANPAHNPGQRNSMSMATGSGGFNIVMFGGRKVVPPGVFRDSNETWTWGRRVACLPTPDRPIRVGSKVECQFDPAEDIQFLGWDAVGFAPPQRSTSNTSFHTEAPGSASITAYWVDEDGTHSETFDYDIVLPNQ